MLMVLIAFTGVVAAAKAKAEAFLYNSHQIFTSRRRQFGKIVIRGRSSTDLEKIASLRTVFPFLIKIRRATCSVHRPLV